MLSSAQSLILRNAINANSAVTSYVLSGADSLIADWYNQPSSFMVWRTRVTAEECNNVIDFTKVDGMTAGKRNEWDWITRFGTFNPSNSNIRAGITDTFTNAVATATAILSLCKRPATNAEALYASGTGTTATPGILTYEGSISADDVAQALRG